MGIIQIIITLALFVLIIIPLSKYLYKVATSEQSFADPVFNRIDEFIYKITGINSDEMSWKGYAIAILVSNLVMALISYFILRIQGINLLNPNHISSMDPDLTFNTVISFITNTDLQNYAGETGLTYLSQMLVITFLMFTASATGLCAAFAFMRGIIGEKKTVGNYFRDMVRVITRVFLPLSIIVALCLVARGVPQTLAANQTVTTIEGKIQQIALGPVASLESIKHIGTNGGGFFNANSAHPFENPTPFTNLLEMLSMMIIPGSLVLTFGHMLKNKKQAWAIFISMAVLLVISIGVCYAAEKAGNPRITALGISNSMGNMEGKEVRFGTSGSSLFTSITTAFTTGSVNNSHDSLTPLGGFVAMWNMMLNVVFGGKGVGFMNMIMYAILTVFLCGLMVGRTPEFLSKKIEAREIKLIALAILVHPFIILMSTAFTLIDSGAMTAVMNKGFHGLSEVLYQFTTSAANNGSSFAGLSANNMYFNITTSIVMVIGRYISIILLMAVAGSLAAKTPVPETVATFRTDNSTFVVILTCVVIIIGALTFLPAIALGPIAEHLTLGL